MNPMQVRTRNFDEVAAVIAAISSALQGLGDDHACFVHCMELHRSGFYKTIEHEFGVHVIPGRAPGLKAGLMRLAFGFSAMIEVENYEMLVPLFSRVGEQAMAALYVVRRSTLSEDALKRMRTPEINAAVLNDPTHMVYQVDEDSADEAGLVAEILSTGDKCDPLLKTALSSDGGAMGGAQR